MCNVHLIEKYRIMLQNAWIFNIPFSDEVSFLLPKSWVLDDSDTQSHIYKWRSEPSLWTRIWYIFGLVLGRLAVLKNFALDRKECYFWGQFIMFYGHFFKSKKYKLKSRLPPFCFKFKYTQTPWLTRVHFMQISLVRLFKRLPFLTYILWNSR